MPAVKPYVMPVVWGTLGCIYAVLALVNLLLAGSRTEVTIGALSILSAVWGLETCYTRIKAIREKEKEYFVGDGYTNKVPISPAMQTFYDHIPPMTPAIKKVRKEKVRSPGGKPAPEMAWCADCKKHVPRESVRTDHDGHVVHYGGSLKATPYKAQS